MGGECFVYEKIYQKVNHKGEIIYGIRAKHICNNKLSISNDLLGKYAMLEIDVRDEIDGLLLDCKKWFGPPE